MKANTILIIYTTIDRQSTGQELIRTLLNERIIGCGLTTQANSQYHWMGDIISDKEWVLWMKTILPLKEKAIDRLGELHPYDIPCILNYTVEANSSYVEWLEQQVE
ncbi:divalent-cation tolerance protein CutA [Membranihabitans marinus]|uniref:divalent-cation tolerance protein CutA n=1 Tax=Membranihabitans marinus TaxID=1227546 RepID=UPI001F20B243|nr:divalent cation tolerance protein CutA [Membranihabitans marinus]